MPLSRSAIEALDPNDPADAVTLQSEALAYYDTAEALDSDVTELQAEVEEVEQQAQNATRRFFAATAYPTRQSAGLRFARGA